MQSIDRMMKIINVFITHNPNRLLSISEIAKECELPVSSIHRILQAMIEHNMIRQDKELKLYGLGVLWLEYGLKIYDTLNYVSTLRPELENLMKTTQSSVYLTRPINSESIIIERIDCTDQSIQAHDKLGLRIPMNIGAANLVMLAHMPQEQAQDIISDLIPEEEMANFHTYLENIKTKSYEISEDEQKNGISTIAAPIFNRHKEIFGAVSIKMENQRFTKETSQEILEKLQNTANKMSWKMR